MFHDSVLVILTFFKHHLIPNCVVVLMGRGGREGEGGRDEGGREGGRESEGER